MHRLLTILLLCVAHQSIQAQLPDVPAAFNALSTKPQLLHLKKNHIKTPSGGHLQGIQCLLTDSDFIITGSSDSYSYYLMASRTELTSIRKLSDDPFHHAGGFQVCDRRLAVGVEDNQDKDRSEIILITFGDLMPLVMHRTVLYRSGEFKRSTAGAVGLARTASGQYLIAVGDWDSRNIDFYISRHGEGKTFDSLTTFHAPDDRPWPSYQSINLLTDTAGRIYLIGFALDGLRNRADLFEVVLHSDRADLILLNTRNFKCRGTSFRYGSGIYVNDTKQLCIYSCSRNVTEHISINIFK